MSMKKFDSYVKVQEFLEGEFERIKKYCKAISEETPRQPPEKLRPKLLHKISQLITQ